ncbi:DNA/RNA nuclease SfsA [Pseudorhizobium halotolerans]|uniref:Sugar fermentation stimulation protein homolog n=1 Tax=Pseudorhizobium halotolerans TaxID=1233081 RepID=A0ABN7JLA5_9HYPH|nr:DNA/RNA nuclease SfsA [Pseudorhizobium halotolerans]CAD7036779.1 DNA/RNA nuclease SfsA [Pseudorhizobium halotolerans]
MLFDPPLVRATLVQRYKRFLFDALLDDGTPVTGFCPNTGSMRGLTTPGSPIWMSVHDSPTRKYRHMLEMVEADGTLVGINAAFANRIAEEALVAGLVPDLGGYGRLRREQRYGARSRIDFLLSGSGRHNCYVEVKNVHFMRALGLAEFPDTVTTRGARHLEELGDMAEAGHRAVMLYVVQRQDCDRLRLCSDLDPRYAAAFRRAAARGVEAYVLRCRVTPQEIVATDLIAMDEAGLPAL